MVVENIARISFTARRTSQQQGNLPVGGRLFGKIVIYNQGMLAFVAKIFSHGAAGIRGNKLQGRRITGTGRYDGGVFHGAVFFQNGMDLGNRGLLLTAGHIDAENIGILLSQNGIYGASCFADLAVTDDQFPLASSHRCHGVNGF